MYKLWNMLKTCFFFWTKNAFFCPSRRTLNMYTLTSFGFGFRRSNRSKNNKDILCIHQNHVLVEFLRTINQQSRLALEFILDLNFQILSNYFGAFSVLLGQFMNIVWWMYQWYGPPDPYYELIGYLVGAYRIAHNFFYGVWIRRLV